MSIVRATHGAESDASSASAMTTIANDAGGRSA